MRRKKKQSFFELHYPLHHSASIHKSSRLLPFHPAVPLCCPNTNVSLSWPHVLFFPFLSHPSSLCPATLWWNEMKCQLSLSSLQLLSANSNSLSLMCLCLSFSLPLCLFLSLSPPISFLPSFTLSCLLPSFSLSLNPFHLCCHPLFYFPHRQACQEDSATCPHAVWCCSICMCMCPYSARHDHIVVCERHCLCPLDINQVWAWVSLSLCFSRTERNQTKKGIPIRYIPPCMQRWKDRRM